MGNENNRKFVSTFEYKLIYIFRINDSNHKGCLKIGDATIHSQKGYEQLIPNSSELNYAAKERIGLYTATAGIVYELLYTEIAVYKVNNGKSKNHAKIRAFRDHNVHSVLKKSGIKIKHFDTEKKQNEWFITDLETAKKAIQCVKDEKSALSVMDITSDKNPIIFRPEQKEAIDKTIKQFKSSNKMLWNAKMRFGKTLSALEVAKQMNFNKTIIITHRPVVSDGWYEDFTKIFYDKVNFDFGSKTKGKNITELLKNNKQFIYFASMQDLRGSDVVGGNYEKNNEVFIIDWDFVVVDEAHEGTQTKLGKTVLEKIAKQNTKVLELSGTPFNLLTNFEEANIYTWDYIMEQQAKNDWIINHFGDSNPYEELPQMNIYTYHLEKFLTNFLDLEDRAFNFREFFRVWTGDIAKDGKQLPQGVKIGDFIYENDIKSFLNLITNKSEITNYPFATEEYRDYFRHTLWILPGVKEAKAFSKLLKVHPIFSFFEIVNVAGDGDEEVEYNSALDAVRKAIGNNPAENYTITLSCGRLTTGVSIPEWTAVLMLAGSYSTAASQYLQTIFRVQTPANINGKIKENCYVFDFAPDRTLKMIAESVQLSARTTNNPIAEKQLGLFLNFCPVIAIDNTGMKEFKVSYLLQELKKAYAERVVKNGFDDIKLYNDELLKLDEIELKEFDNLKKIIGTTKQANKIEDIDINKEGFSNEEYEEIEKIKKTPKRDLTEEDKEKLEKYKKQKENKLIAISILRGISIRIPLLVYGIDKNINDDITINNFADKNLIDDLSWDEFMPKGITREIFLKFSKYYDKDIFLAASRRIRYISKSADDLEPTERVKKMASLFLTFKNPDRETVLTPWRVVNMHMSDCLGGYDFFDEKHENILDEPRFVNQGEVTKNTLCNLNSNILEINSKTGLYPLYLTYSLYRAKCMNESELTFEQKQNIWDYIIQNNVFVVCKTPMAKLITKRTLAGYRDVKVNTKYFENLINQIAQASKFDSFVKKVSDGKNYWNLKGKSDNMKFNAIVGNPPYQENISSNEGNASLSKQLFPLFIISAIKLKPDYSSLITPARWFAGNAQDNSFINLREFLRIENHFKKIVYYANEKDLFQNVSIAGGLNYYLYDSNYTGNVEFVEFNNGEYLSEYRPLFEEGLDIVLSNGNNYKILQKIINRPDFESFTQITKGRNAFGIVGKDIEKITSTQKHSDEIELRCAYEEIRFIKKELVTKNIDIMENWKVFTSKGNGGAGLLTDDKQVAILGKAFIGKPFSACTDSLIPIGCYKTEIEAINTQKYMRTKFLRFLVGILKVSQNVSQNVYQFVPIQNFTEISDIDWNKTITEIDMQLFIKYKLTSEEQEFIKQKIKEIN